MFNAILIEKKENQYQSSLTQLDDAQLPAGDVTVRIDYSTLNYKDGLAISGRSPVVRQFPMVPGIDFAGTVEASSNPEFTPGQKVFLNGWGVGEKHWGGLAQKACVSADWLLPLPEKLSTYDAMAVGTAGYTAMLAIMALEKQGVMPDSGPVLVTGANGGVGSFAVPFLARLAYKVIASTGRPEEVEHLTKLGASEIIHRDTLSAAGKPLSKEQWAGAIDSVGSHTLANVCAGTRYGGTVAACGLAQGMGFPSSVAPFILRGVTLAGIDSVMCPKAIRQQAWQRIAELLDQTLVEEATKKIGMSEVIATAHDLLDGKVKGRVVVDVNQ